jgi:hypothetical protein
MSTQLAAAPSSGFRIDQQPVTNAEKIDNFQTHTKRVFCDLISVKQYFRTLNAHFELLHAKHLENAFTIHQIKLVASP